MVDQRRRNMLKGAALLPLAFAGDCLAVTTHRVEQSISVPVRLMVHTQQRGRRVDESLAGLSYETRQLIDPTFFSPGNRELVRLFRELNPRGVLRIGGNTSDSAIWSEYKHHGPLPTPKPRKYGLNKPSGFMLRPEALRTLAGFLHATGWKLIFGVNLRIGVPEMAAELARAVQLAVGDRLLAIQIGNEANNYEKDYSEFDATWMRYAKAIRSVGVAIAGPDTGANTDWVIEYAKLHGAGNAFLSRHYYRDAAPHGSIAGLLAGDPEFMDEVDRIMQVADRYHLPFRLTEANSYYSGGRDGVSNAFASALWGADFMLALAKRGVAGINFHGGPLRTVEASLGHTDIKAARETSANLSARRYAVTSHYSPIAGDDEYGFQPDPLYFGMQLAQQFADARMLDNRLEANGINLTAYSAVRADHLLVALINKDMTRDAEVSLEGLAGYREGQAMQLRAPALSSRKDIVFRRFDGQMALDRLGRCRITVPRGSAAVVRCQRAVV